MTDEELDALEALDRAATPGPWTVKYEQFDDEPYVDEIHGPDEPSNPLIETDCGIYGPKKDDAECLVAARNALPRLIAEIRRLRAVRGTG